MSGPKYVVGETVTVLGVQGAVISGPITEIFVKNSSNGRNLGYAYNISLTENGKEYVVAYDEENLGFYIKVDDDGLPLGFDTDE